MHAQEEVDFEPQRVVNPEVDTVLERTKVMGALGHARELVRGIIAAETLEQQVSVFTHSPIFEASKVLNSPEMNISPEEAKIIEGLNKKLLTNPDVMIFLLGDKETTGVLYATVQELLRQSGISDEKVLSEMVHYGDVVELSKTLFKDNAVLPLVAAVHDSFKFVDGMQHLGLHEVLSTHVGSELLVSALESAQEKGLLTLEDGELAALNKLAKRAIFTHGNDEYPEITSKPLEIIDGVELRELFKSLYVKPEHRSYPSDSATPLTTAQEVISGMNLADILVGAHPSSFVKYNLAWRSEVVCESTLATYLHTKILASLSGNLSPTVAFYLQDPMGEEYAAISDKMTEYSTRAAMLVLLLDPEAKKNMDGTAYLDVTQVLEQNRDSNVEVAAQEVKASFAVLTADMQSKEKRQDFNEAFSHLITLILGLNLRLPADSGN